MSIEDVVRAHFEENPREIRTLQDVLDFVVSSGLCTEDGELSETYGGETEFTVVVDPGPLSQEEIGHFSSSVGDGKTGFFCDTESGEKITTENASHTVKSVVWAPNTGGVAVTVETKKNPAGRDLRYAIRDRRVYGEGRPIEFYFMWTRVSDLFGSRNLVFGVNARRTK